MTQSELASRVNGNILARFWENFSSLNGERLNGRTSENS